MIRRLALVLLAFAVLAGSAYAARRNPNDPQKRYNPADQAWAKAIRIQRGDLGAGDWRVESSNDEGTAPPGCKSPNLSDLVLTGEGTTPDWSRNGSFVGSVSEIWLNEKQAGIAWKRDTAVPFGKCLVTGLHQAIGKVSGVRLSIDSSGPIKIAKLAPRVFTYGLRFRLIGTKTITGRISVYAFARARADGMLFVISFTKPMTPVPPALERRLAALVAKRLQR